VYVYFHKIVFVQKGRYIFLKIRFLDAQVGRRLFEAVIGGPQALLRHKAVVFCTRQLQHLHSAAVGRVLALARGGRVAAYGPFEQVRPQLEALLGDLGGGNGIDDGRTTQSLNNRVEVTATNTDWKRGSKIIRSTPVVYELGSNDDGALNEEVDFARIGGGVDDADAEEASSDVAASKRLANDDSELPLADEDADEKAEGDVGTRSGLGAVEKSESGEVAWRTYGEYCAAAGGPGAAGWLAGLMLAAEVRNSTRARQGGILFFFFEVRRCR
jgi:hypothetical protein